MLFSMFSPRKKEDREWLLELADLIELLARMGTTEALNVAEGYGEVYLKLEEKIKTHDYTKDDQEDYQLEQLINGKLCHIQN